jgi:hypothetical protein
MPSKSVLGLNEIFSVDPQYYRSINLERDYDQNIPFEYYQITSTGLKIAHRLIDATSGGCRSRAWSITGPYGTGKSAFALFATQLLSLGDDGKIKYLTKKFKDAGLPRLQSDVVERIKNNNFCPFLPVLVVGRRDSIAIALLEALQKALEKFWANRRGVNPAIIDEVIELKKKAQKAGRVTTTQIVEVFETAAEKVVKSGYTSEGLLIVIDELGKFLEYASKNPESSDIYLLQELAEAASRSQFNTIFLVTILHQGFDQYATHLSKAEQKEWQKIQGRFEDVSFVETTENIIYLTSNAIKVSPAYRNDLQPLKDSLAKEIERSGLLRNVRNKDEFSSLLLKCLPFHPLTSMVIGPLFRTRLAQNERSFFGFLNASGPFTFQEFLKHPVLSGANSPLYTIDILYDYITAILGSGLYIQNSSKKWASIDSTIARLPGNFVELDERIIKVIGLLNIVSEFTYLKASPELIRFSVSGKDISNKDVDVSLKRLSDASLVIYRKYNNTYSIWEGSDLDVDSLLSKALDKVQVEFSLARLLSTTNLISPSIASKHFYETGTLRYFKPVFISARDLEEFLQKSQSDEDADGLLVNVLVTSEAERRQAVESIRTYSYLDNSIPILFAILKNLDYLESIAKEVAAYDWCIGNTPALESDVTARKELHLRYSESQRILSERLNGLIAYKNLGSDENSYKCEFYYLGKPINISTRMGFKRLLSEIFSRAYQGSPKIKNELINKNLLSSTAAAARRSLVQAMIQKSSESQLGFIGYPPEKTMYATLLEHSGLHKFNKKEGIYAFCSPKEDGISNYSPFWSKITEVLREKSSSKCCVQEIYDELISPPFGLKEGPLPVLLCAYFLTYEHSLALYEEDSFIPELSIAVFERLIKTPSKFFIQLCDITGIRSSVLEQLLQIVRSDKTDLKDRSVTILSLVKPLCFFAKELPDYVKNTRTLRKDTRAIRDCLLNATDPYSLVFVQLPEACGIQPITSDSSIDNKELEMFYSKLRQGLKELQMAYKILLDALQSQIIQVFLLPSDIEKAKYELAKRGALIKDITVDTKLKALILRIEDEEVPTEHWLESMGILLTNKPIRSWNDQDYEKFKVELSQISKTFERFESLALSMGLSNTEQEQIFRIGITTPRRPESEYIVRLDESSRAEVNKLEQLLEEALLNQLNSGNEDTALAALSQLAKNLISRKCEAQNAPSIGRTNG